MTVTAIHYDSRLLSATVYCPRCDEETLWTRVRGGLGCDCGLVEGGLLADEEFERIKAHEAVT